MPSFHRVRRAIVTSGAATALALTLCGCSDSDGRKYTATELPLETLVSSSKGCYIGQEVIVRIRDRGHVNRVLTGLTLDGDEVPPSGAPVVIDGREVGRVTSAVRSFALGRPIAI